MFGVNKRHRRRLQLQWQRLLPQRQFLTEVSEKSIEQDAFIVSFAYKNPFVESQVWVEVLPALLLLLMEDMVVALDHLILQPLYRPPRLLSNLKKNDWLRPCLVEFQLQLSHRPRQLLPGQAFAQQAHQVRVAPDRFGQRDGQRRGRHRHPPAFVFHQQRDAFYRELARA